ncbi:hypothetical protein [Streptomyces sp. NPDC002746]
MPDVPTESLAQSAYDLDLEMALVLPSATPASWGASVHEAARILVDRPWGRRNSLSVSELHTLSLLLFARTYTGDREPGDVPVAELREALNGPVDREPPIRDEIDHALTETGQGYDSEAFRSTPLWSIYLAVQNRYGNYGGSPLADDVAPPTPGPSPMRLAAISLAQFFADYTAPNDTRTTAPQVAPGPLVVQADLLQMVSANSVVRIRCSCGDLVRSLRVDGPTAVRECVQGHASVHWQLDAARVRVAVARATGVRPSSQGSHRFPKLMIVEAELPRHTDPTQANVYLRPASTPLVGRDDILRKLSQIHDRG